VKILILGGDGYLGWPTAMHLQNAGHEITVIDDYSKRHREAEVKSKPLWEVPLLEERAHHEGMNFAVGTLENYRFIYEVLMGCMPDAIIHYAEQPSAPYSMMGHEQAVSTQQSNVIGTLNLLFAMQAICPEAHLIKLGTMGEYGTPNIDIEEGYLNVEHNGRSDRLPYPKQPNSFYHLSKCHDSANILFASKTWGLRTTDLNQGIVYGLPNTTTSFHYDDIFGTVLNRFLVQAAVGQPLTVYGGGGQRRAMLHISDTLQCVELAVNNPPEPGEMRVMNQFTESFSVMVLARIVEGVSGVGWSCIPNPRTESEEHYYNAKNTNLKDLGLTPQFLTDDLMQDMYERVKQGVWDGEVDKSVLLPRVKWRGGS